MLFLSKSVVNPCLHYSSGLKDGEIAFNEFMHKYFSINNWVHSWRASICFHLRCVTIQTLASLLMLPLKRPAVWIMDLVTQLSVCQQLDCTIMEFHAGYLHEGWVRQHSEWGLGKAIADRQCCSTSQNNIFLFVHFLELLCLWQRLLLQPLMPVLAETTVLQALSPSLVSWVTVLP